MTWLFYRNRFPYIWKLMQRCVAHELKMQGIKSTPKQRANLEHNLAFQVSVLLHDRLPKRKKPRREKCLVDGEACVPGKKHCAGCGG